ncbi:calcium/sodium antiporter [Arenicella sp. 4NH20-0111]|uniref:calcium/sodium antiporter n=1 Tax=Arenicella sp. 4NH20-0111 TaxID=3127648 RepID=UPI00310AA8C1
MSIFVAVALVLVGFVLLIWSADVLVDNASELASNLGVSTFLIGIVIVGFGTSAPELFVSAMAAMEDKGNLALGNALGSNITNIGLVLGAAAVVGFLSVDKIVAKRDIPMVIVAGIVSVALLIDGTLSGIDGLVLLALLVAYLVYSAKAAGGSTEEVIPEKSTALSAAWTIGSIIVLMGASRILVEGAVTIATFFNVSELLIGLTIVAIGTSLPELAAAIAAAKKGVHEMIIGNIIGSNVFNTLGVLGLTGALRETGIDTGVLWRDFPVMFAFTIFMLIVGLYKGGFGRREGILLLIGYFSYLGFLIISAT